VLNIGTLTTELVDSMIEAGRAANEKGIPVVLDAVGVGATALRNEKAALILERVRVDIIKGNASEVARLAGMNVTTRGVESSSVEGDLLGAARSLARARGAVVVVTGGRDIVTDGDRVFYIDNGHRLMGALVGTGCMAASVIGAFAAVEADLALAAAAALACYGIAGELAALDARGPGSFKSALYDAVYNLNADVVREKCSMTQL